VVKWLLKNGASLEVQDEDRSNALILTAMGGALATESVLRGAPT
jgi:hypothetical protein